jgi:ketosteroid isomerase-like protein
MSDTEAIRRTIAEYCQLYDERLFDEFEQIWTEDATFRVQDRPGGARGRKQISAYLEGRTATKRGPQPTLRSVHGSFNPIIDVHGDTANAWVEYVAFGERNGSLSIGSGGRYHFRMVKDSDRWRILDLETRLISPDHIRSRPEGSTWPMQIDKVPFPSEGVGGLQPAPQELTDLEAVRRTIAEYCEFYDERMFDEFEQIWTEDATFRVEGRAGGAQGRKEIAAHLESRGTGAKRGLQPLLRGIHGVFTPMINIEGDRAQAAADYLSFRVRDGVFDITSGGRFHFQMVKQSDRWRIADLETRLLSPELARPKPDGTSPWPMQITSAPTRKPMKATAHRELSDFEAVRRTVVEYGQAHTDGRYRDMQDIYVDDAIFRVEGRGSPIVGRVNIGNYLARRTGRDTAAPAAPTDDPGTFNPIIEIDGDTALARADYIGFGGGELPFKISSGGRYYFKMVRQPDRWRITEFDVRLIAPELIRSRPSTAPAWPSSG